MTDKSIPEQLAGGRLTIDLGALVANWRTLAARAPGATTAAVVKADGYGVGALEASKALAAAGCGTFFVGLPEEGIRLRAALPAATIYVLAGLIPGSVEALTRANLRPVLGSPTEIDAWIAARRAGASTGAAIHIDTGMNRLGLTAAEARDLVAAPDRIAALAPSLLMSHLACADTPAHPLNARQLAAFRIVRSALPQVPASLANSSGIYLGRDYHFDLTRPGVALYGAVFIDGQPPLQTVAKLEARVLRVRDVTAGDTVGYGATETAATQRRIAVLGAGYADGYHRAASSRDGRSGGRVFLRGHFAALIGRVSMDLIAVDVTAVRGVEEGDWAELFGPNLPVDEVAARAGTIGYELLTGLGHRYARRYAAK
ncbi:MAG TPA: alanine racemase [Bauldia sp.]